MNYWKDKRAIVTGASKGLGKVLAETLVERGAKVLLVARGETALEQAADKMRTQVTGDRVTTLAADVTNLQDVDQIVAIARDELGGVDMLCHSAGRSMRGDILSTTPDQHCELWELNFLAPVQLTQALSNDLAESRGHVVLIGSLASKVAPRLMGAYPASKFPLCAYAQQLRLAWGNKGPHALLVCPGPIDDPDSEGRYDEQTEGLPDSAKQAGGGAKISKIDPNWLSEQILRACERRTAELVIPRKARLLFSLGQIWPGLGDWLLARSTAK